MEAEQIMENWNELLKIINERFSGERRDKLIEIHKYFEERMSLAPASGRDFFHSAFPGGYVTHVLNVIKFAIELYDVWLKNGSMIDYNKEELVLCALVHDLGKVGNLDEDLYLPNEDEWRRNKLRETYNNNNKIQFMFVQDRTLYLLQHFGLKLSEKEWIAIKIHDGLYHKGNEGYFMAYDFGKELQSNLALILHQADFMAQRIEYETWKNNGSAKPKPIVLTTKITNKTLKNENKSSSNIIDDDEFDKLFEGIK
jgi:hypothetical protein